MIEIITIGAELLNGTTVDTNSAYIGQKLLSHGYSVSEKATVSDEKEALTEILTRALEKHDIVITTGGLGPTFDDLTLPIAAALFDQELVHSAEVEAHLKSRFGDHVSIPQQSKVPKNARVFLNDVGTAPSCILSKEGKHLILLPGVPAEMRYFMDTHVMPFIDEVLEKQEKIEHATAFLFGLTESEVDPFLREIQEKHPGLEMGIYPGYGTLGVTLKAKGSSVEEARLEVFEKYADVLYADDDRRIEKALHTEMLAGKKTLALAESCTGGMIAARLAQIPKTSDFFLGGIVSYSNAFKEKFLHVRSLATHGAVSEETAREMAEGALETSGADYAIAVTGIAGPDGGTPEKPVGTVWAAIAERGGATYAGKLKIKSRKSRETIIEYTGTYVMGSLWRYLRHGKEPFKELL